jgi:hypothetical protein
MLLPNADQAVVDLRKLCDYCLNSEHDEGKHKARLFAAALGITREDAEELRSALLQAVKRYEAKLGRRDQYGQRYIVDFPLERRGKRAIIRSGWIIEHGSDTPRLISCFPM